MNYIAVIKYISIDNSEDWLFTSDFTGMHLGEIYVEEDKEEETKKVALGQMWEHDSGYRFFVTRIRKELNLATCAWIGDGEVSEFDLKDFAKFKLIKSVILF